MVNVLILYLLRVLISDGNRPPAVVFVTGIILHAQNSCIYLNTKGMPQRIGSYARMHCACLLRYFQNEVFNPGSFPIQSNDSNNYFSFQMSRLYSAIVRSLEKNPAFAMLTRLI